jgi:hypothetical protein
MIYEMNARTKKFPDEVKKAWDEEVGRRIDDVVAGRVKTRDAEEVLASLEAKYARRSAHADRS